MAHVPASVGAIFEAAVVKVARPDYGRTFQSAGDALNALHGLRFLRWSCTHFEVAEADDNATAANLETTTRFKFRTSAAARYVWFGAHVYAEDNVTTPPSLSVELQTMAGVIIDGPVVWSKANGQLPLRTKQRRRPANAPFTVDSRGATLRRERFLSSGTRIGAGTEPRIFDLGSAATYKGVEVQLVATMARVRPYCMMALEAYQGEL